MTDGRHPTPGCVDAETLAAFMDGRLEPRERAAVEAHLADCEECYEVWMEARAVREPARSHLIAATSRGRWVTTIGLLAASVLAAVWLWPVLSNQFSAADRATEALMQALGGRRVAEGRLADLPWGPRQGAFRSGAPEQVSPEVEQAVAELRRLARDDRRPETLAAQGVALLAVGRLDEAVNSLLEATQDFPPNSGHLSDLSVALLARYDSRRVRLDAVQALDAARRALVAEPQHVAALFNLALAAEALGDHVTARSSLEAYLAIDSTSPWATEVRERLVALPRSEGSGLGADSIEHVWRSLIPSWAESVLNGQNVILVVTAEESHAIAADASLRQLVAAMTAAQTWPQERRLCLARAIRHSEHWEVAFSEARSEDANQIARRLPAEFRCAGLTPIEVDWRLAIAHYDEGRLAEAEAVARRGALDAASGGHVRTAVRFNLLGALVAVSQGRTSDAERPARAALEGATQLGSPALIAPAAVQLSEVLREQGDVVGAWDAIAQAIGLAAHVRYPRQHFALWATASVGALDDRLDGAALVMSDALIRNTQGWVNPIGLAFGNLQRAAALSRLLLTDEAMAALDDAERSTLLIQSTTARAEMQAYLDLERLRAGVAPDSADPAAAFRKSGNTLMEVLALLWQGNRAWDHDDRDNAVRTWQAGADLVETQRTTLGGWHRMTRLNRAWDVYERLIAAQLNVNAWLPLSTLERARAQQARNDLVGPGAGGQPALEPEALAAWLGDHDQALVYCSLSDELVIWHLTDQGITIRREPSLTRAVLEDAVQMFRQNLDGQPREPFPFESLLVADVKPSTPDSTLIIVPDGPLHRLPFAALRPGGGPPLVARLRLVHAPSLAAARAAPLVSSRQRVAVVAVSDSIGETLPALPWVDREVEALRHLHPGATIVANADATADEVLNQLENSHLLHFSGHAISDELAPWRSYLALAGNARLTSERLAKARVQPGATIVLAACDAAGGLPFNGDGVFSLARSFLLAGAGTIVGSLAPARDYPTSSLLIDVHEALAKGVHPVAALAESQRRAIAAGHAPSHWASFIALGALPERTD